MLNALLYLNRHFNSGQSLTYLAVELNGRGSSNFDRAGRNSTSDPQNDPLAILPTNGIWNEYIYSWRSLYSICVGDRLFNQPIATSLLDLILPYQ